MAGIICVKSDDLDYPDDHVPINKSQRQATLRALNLSAGGRYWFKKEILSAIQTLQRQNVFIDAYIMQSH